MAAPTTPYSTADQVSYLMQALYFKGRPTESTVPSTNVLETLIDWTDGVIDATFRSVGYVIPFAEVTAGSWPISQTQWLSFMSAVGAAAFAGGYVLQPFPVHGMPRGSGEENAYARLFDTMRSEVFEGIRFNAQYTLGTKAEKIMADPYGPRLDFLEDYIDPTRYLLIRDYSDMIMSEYEDMDATNLDLDYFYNLRATTAV